jgi:hypothetical protein
VGCWGANVEERERGGGTDAGFRFGLENGGTKGRGRGLKVNPCRIQEDYRKEEDERSVGRVAAESSCAKREVSKRSGISNWGGKDEKRTTKTTRAVNAGQREDGRLLGRRCTTWYGGEREDTKGREEKSRR